MKASGRLLIAAAIGTIVGTLGLTGSALANGTLNTPVSTTAAPDRTFCSGVNVGTAPIANISVDLIRNDGVILATNTCSNVAADADCFVQFATPNSSRCRVTFTGSGKKIRGALTIVSSSGDKFVLPATSDSK
jgi:hypothetical protein